MTAYFSQNGRHFRARNDKIDALNIDLTESPRSTLTPLNAGKDVRVGVPTNAEVKGMCEGLL